VKCLEEPPKEIHSANKLEGGIRVQIQAQGFCVNHFWIDATLFRQGVHDFVQQTGLHEWVTSFRPASILLERPPG